MINIPNKVKVGGLTYKVVVTDTIDDDRCAAICDLQKLVIKIEKTNPYSMQHTFIHELLHAINGEIEEETIEYMAMMLYQVIVDNPSIFKGGEQKK